MRFFGFPIDERLLETILVALVSALVLLHLKPRRFYLVRHGQTLLNAEHIRQGAEGALSEKGRLQARETAIYFKDHPVRRIVTSSYERAQETAHIIDKELRVPIIVSPLLVERRNPSEVIGKNTDDPEVARINDQIDLGYHPDDYRFSDEENFADIKVRARKALALLSRQGEGDTIIVTHHHFLKMLVAYMLYREQLHAGDFIKLSFFNYSHNAHVSVCQYNPWMAFSKTRGWSVISFDEGA